ncbi:uncharacterized protein PGTG_04249 [Puccinia graminis f. sp. tritici CRL 75-36-700-3]|uniref:NADH:ubiquinone oxidoreductase intermediate-associated protein 30 domain-containing protein n=1 Tax=Puccinia graminis f. sp. tritici (strain CRL 75-36-700-3 / race SCCL) TaxID=418459 RepID=E3K2X3_PUCGT|nr:uncharacterized protein PGTG_04249 [Puccinia graminis f. sp. tritici CRL 75-36-700-3]EFP78293.2 hypothetical protein PGTG_04249 [Puccinia graminis f. sp. tritici CRL 75-36-700-3]
MQLPSAITLTALLASFAMSTRAVYPPRNDYIMSMGLNWSNGYQSAYNSKGEDAFRWFKDYDKPRKGISTSRLADGSSTTLFALTSYKNLNDAWAERDYRLQLRQFRSDLWHFNYPDKSGTRRYYRFNKNSSNMGGRIYRVSLDQPEVPEGLLRTQMRYDTWWKDPKGREAFTLSIVDQASVVGHPLENIQSFRKTAES